MYQFLSGVIAAGFLVASAFFFRFWKSTRDWLFATFGLSFILFALGQLAASIAQLSVAREDDYSWVYLFRLAGFIMLIVAIVWKNVPRSHK